MQASTRLVTGDWCKLGNAHPCRVLAVHGIRGIVYAAACAVGILPAERRIRLDPGDGLQLTRRQETQRCSS